MHRSKGILGVFAHPDDLIAAAKKVRHMGCKKFDAYTPFPVHGLDAAMGLKRSWVPWATFVIGVSGWCLGFLFQAWALSVSWPVNIGGKPPVSWPAFIPVSFEMMVLLAGVSTALILFGMCWPFDFWRSPVEPRLTRDRFGLFVQQSDPKFQQDELTRIFKEYDVDAIHHLV